MADAVVRPAAAGDVGEIARIQVTTWRTGFADLLPPDVVAGLDEEAAREVWSATIAQGPARVFVAVEGDWVVGYCSAGLSPESESAAADGVPVADAEHVGLVGALLVEPRWGRRGHGGRLLAAAGEALREQGATRGICWVPQGNKASTGFFRRVGWVPDGVVRTLDAAGTPLREIRLTGGLDFQFV